MASPFSANQILLVSKSEDVIEFCQEELSDEFDLRILSSFDEITSSMSSSFPVMFIDGISSDFYKLEANAAKINVFLGTIFILSNGNSFDSDILQEMIPSADFIFFPCDGIFLKSLVSNVIAKWTPPVQSLSVNAKKFQKNDVPGFEKIITCSEKMYELKKKLATVAVSDISVLMLGESGTGKSFIAEMIHKNSARCNKNFKSINMATIPEQLAESTLFGAVKGAYTGAVNRAGIFAEADGGTIFMDEIAELSLALQTKLLTVLDNGKFYPVGSDKEVKTNVRMIFATNANLKALIKSGKFRSDLYYRIAKMKLMIPPLRMRLEDVELLAKDFCDRQKKQISKDAIAKLQKYAWPGNVRELHNCIEVACALCKSDVVNADDIFLDDDAFDFSIF